MLPLLGAVLVFSPGAEDADVARLDVRAPVSAPGTAATSPAAVAPAHPLSPASSAPSASPAAVVPAPAPVSPGTVAPGRLNVSEIRLAGLLEELNSADWDEVNAATLGRPSDGSVQLTGHMDMPNRAELRSRLRGYLDAQGQSRVVYSHTRATSSVDQGWSPGADAVEAQLARESRLAESRRAEVAARTARINGNDVEQLVSLTRFAYAKGAPDLAASVHRSSDLLVSWNNAPIDLTVTATFRRRPSGGGDLELDVTRTENLGQPLAVSFPPGTYGVGLTRAPKQGSRRYFPKAQDLALLRAPVVVLKPGQDRLVVEVPVACASYGIKSPRADHPYRLERFATNTAVAKLMVALCAGEQKSDSEAQLAVWIARNDVDRSNFLRRARSLRTFHGYRSMGAGDVRGASELLIQGGVDPHSTRFYPRPRSPVSAPAVAPVQEREAAPAVEPAPVPTRARSTVIS
jgi:hypothetical protein